jgi:putative spermidine/putrescine transport system ATP-binding protein
VLGRGAGRDTVLAGRITAVNFLGSVIRLRADLGGQVIDFDTFNAPAAPPPTPGSEVEISLAARDLMVIPD